MAIHIRRREFSGALAALAATWPRASRAQQSQRTRRIAALMSYAASDVEAQAQIVAFRAGLQQLGWAEDRNIRIETRWATPEDAEAIQRFANELVALNPDVILSSTTPTTRALLQQTRSIPIVFAIVADPVGSGFVASFARPGGNVSGFIFTEPTMVGKWLELLKEIAPRTTRAVMLYNPTTAPYADFWLKPFKETAPAFGIEPMAAPIRDLSEVDSVLAAQAREPNGALIPMPDSFTDTYRLDIISLVARYRLPAVYPFRHFAAAGGLLSYGVDRTDNFRRAAGYVDRILKGEKPAELPVQAPNKFELVLNLKTAKALGIEVSSRLQQLANDIIE